MRQWMGKHKWSCLKAWPVWQFTASSNEREGSELFWCYFGCCIKFFKVLNDHIHLPYCRRWYCQRRPRTVLSCCLYVLPTRDEYAWHKASYTSEYSVLFHTQAVTESLGHFSRVKCNLMRLKKALCCSSLYLHKEGKKKKTNNLPKALLSIKEEGR